MKTKYFLISILFLSYLTIYSQTTDIVTGLGGPTGLLLNGTDLYIAEFDGNKISKIDISASTPVATDVITGLSSPSRLALHGNDLYITEYNGGKISKIDISAGTPVATDVITGLNRPTGLALHGTDLYIAEFGDNKISKIDISASTPVATDVVTGLNFPYGLALDGTDLYIAERSSNKISKIDISASTPVATDVVTGLGFPYGLALDGTDLYIAERSSNKISKIDISAATPVATDVITDLNDPYDLALHGTDLYIAERSGNKISKLSLLPATLTVTTTAANTIGSSSATLGGVVTADGGNTVTERGIVYAVTSTNADPEIGGTGVTQDTNGSGTGAFAKSIAGLTVGTNYSFKAYATNSDGTSYGAVETFMTTGAGLTWTGTTDTNWNDATNWNPNAVPLSTDDVTIPNVATKPIINNTGAIVNNLTVDAASMLTVNGGGSLIVSSTSTGNITYERTIDFVSGNLNGWYLMASPVVGQVYNDAYATTNDLATSGTNRGLATYTTSSDSWDYLQNTDSNAGTFSSGKGYSMKKGTSAGAVSFTGTLNTDDVAVTLSTAGNGFHLIGNPYPSYINSGTFLSSNTSKLTSETIWVWNQATDSYDTKVTANNFKVAPAQGFFVQCAAVGDVIFDKTNQDHEGTDTFQRQTTPEIKLLVADESTSRYAEIYYFENATTGFDNGYDGELFGGVQNDFELYSHLLSDNLNKKYQIQSLPNSEYETMAIPVGLKADAGKEITFSAETMNLPTDIKVFLEDKEANIFTRLDEANTDYTVTLSEALDGIGRFYIHTSTNALSVHDVALNTVSVYKSDVSTLRILGLPQGNTSIKLYSVLGKELINNTFESNGIKDISVSKLATGMYIAKIQTEVGTLNKKIILE